MYEYDPAAVLARSRRKRSVTGHYSPRRVGYDSTPILSLSAGAGHGSLEREKTLISSGTTTHASSPAFRCLLPGGVVSRSRRGIQYFFDSDNWNRNIRSEMSMRVIKKAELVVARCSIISHAWRLLQCLYNSVTVLSHRLKMKTALVLVTVLAAAAAHVCLLSPHQRGSMQGLDAEGSRPETSVSLPDTSCCRFSVQVPKTAST